MDDIDELFSNLVQASLNIAASFLTTSDGISPAGLKSSSIFELLPIRKSK